MLKKIAIAISLLTLTTQANARGFDVKLASEMAEFTYLTESSTFGYGGADIGFGVLFTEDNDYQLGAKLLISGNPAGNNKSLQFGVGGKLLYVSLDAINEEVGALALAGQVRYIIPSSTPIAFRLGAAFAPSITSFSGADIYGEYELAVEIEVTPSAQAYLGYRKMQYDFEGGGKFILDDSVHVGIKFEF
jgi:hypothetical protein